jgi:hypothetical protein
MFTLAGAALSLAELAKLIDASEAGRLNIRVKTGHKDQTRPPSIRTALERALFRYFPAHTKAAKARFSCGRSILSRKVHLLGREQVSRKFLGEQAFFDKPATPFLDT